MTFNDYYEMWNRYGVKLTANLEITKVILDRVDLQNEVCDLIWVINAANQNNKSPGNLSHTVINEIRRLAPSLLSHKGFKKYATPAEVEKRAERHYRGDHALPNRFIQRQPKVENILKSYINNATGQNVEMTKSFEIKVCSYIDDDDIKI